MINGQKVVKVFCHEEAAQAGLRPPQRRAVLTTPTRANGYANMLMPMMGNLGNLQYVIMAIVGGALAIAGMPNLGLTA